MRGQMGKLIDFMHGRIEPSNDTEALHVAAFEGDLKEIRRLIQEKGVNPDAERSTVMGASVSQTPIFLAIQEGNSKAAALLAELGASIDVLNDMRMTPLMNAASHTDIKQVELFLSLRADPNYFRESDGANPLSFSILHKGIDSRTVKKKERAARIAQLLLDSGADVERPEDHPQSVLMLAARENLPLHIDVFLQAGADPERKCKLKWAPEWTALDHSINEGSHHARKLLEQVTKTPPIVKRRGTV